MSPYDDTVSRAATSLRWKLNIANSVTITKDFEEEYNCSVILEEGSGVILDVKFNTDADELLFRLKWAK